MVNVNVDALDQLFSRCVSVLYIVIHSFHSFSYRLFGTDNDLARLRRCSLVSVFCFGF